MAAITGKNPYVKRLTEDKINEFFAGKGHVGIFNVGNTCFVSSVFQLLSHCPTFMRSVVKYSRNNARSSNHITRVLSDMFIKQFFNSSSSALDPSTLLKAFSTSDACHSDMRSHIHSKRQVDAQEFLIQLLESIEKELADPMSDEHFSTAHPALANNAALNGASVPLRVFMDRKWIDEHKRIISEFSSTTNSIVHGQLLREIVCSNCNARHPSSDVFSTFTIDLFSDKPSEREEFTDCMMRVFSSESLTDSGWKCDNCKKVPKNPFRTCTLWRAPEVLLILVKRFDPLDRWNGKLSVPLTLAKHISLNGACAENSPAQQTCDGGCGGTCYRLLSIVSHYGSANYGHYISFFRDTLQDVWYKCDDESVTQISYEEIDEKNTYILAYERYTPRGG